MSLGTNIYYFLALSNHKLRAICDFELCPNTYYESFLRIQCQVFKINGLSWLRVSSTVNEAGTFENPVSCNTFCYRAHNNGSSSYQLSKERVDKSYSYSHNTVSSLSQNILCANSEQRIPYRTMRSNTFGKAITTMRDIASPSPGLIIKNIKLTGRFDRDDLFG